MFLIYLKDYVAITTNANVKYSHYISHKFFISSSLPLPTTNLLGSYVYGYFIEMALYSISSFLPEVFP